MRIWPVVVTLAAALAPVVPAQDTTKVSFCAEVLPILRASCAGCHQPAKAKGDVVLTSHGSLMAHDEDRDPLVVPGDPAGSLLIEVVTAAEGEQPAMPDEGDPLSAVEIDVLRRWIAQGAEDDTPVAVSAISPARPPVYASPPVVTSLAFSPDGELLAVSGYHEVLLHRADGSGLVARLVGQAQRIESVAFSPDGKSLAVVGGSPGVFGELQIWDVAERRLTSSHAVTNDCLFGVSWSPDGKLVAFGATDTASRALDVATGEQVLYQSAHDDWVLGTVFSTDASHLVTISRDRSMKLILVAEQQFIDNITSITPGVLRGGLMAVDRHPTKDELLIGGADGEPKLYRMYREKKRVIGDDYNKLQVFERQSGRIYAARFARNGERVVFGSSHPGGGVVSVCSVEKGATLWTWKAERGIYAATFRPDGSVVAAAGFAGTVYLLDATTGELITEFVAVPIERRRVVQLHPSSGAGREGVRAESATAEDA